MPELAGDPRVYMAITALGFVIGAAGHLYKSTKAIVFGIVLIMVATVALPVTVYLVRGGGD